VIGDGNSDYSLRFTQPGGAAFEASEALPLNLRKEKTDTNDAATYYFYVPKACRSFQVVFDMTYGSAARLLVKGPADAVELDQAAEPRGNKSFECKPTGATAGRVWSLTIDDPPQGKRKYTTLYLEGVPPLLAETPAQVLIAKGDE
jgi:hypothetical protein